MRKIVKLGLFLCVLGFVFLLWANYSIDTSTQSYISDDHTELPAVETGLLLGTSRTLKNGNPNEYFRNRITAAAILFKSKKIRKLIISGDNSSDSYNEPMDMKNELLLLGIPDSCMHLDFAGFRTYDSVIRGERNF